jgi:hypothetical protein
METKISLILGLLSMNSVYLVTASAVLKSQEYGSDLYTQHSIEVLDERNVFKLIGD